MSVRIGGVQQGALHLAVAAVAEERSSLGFFMIIRGFLIGTIIYDI